MPAKRQTRVRKLLRTVISHRAPAWAKPQWWTARPAVAGTTIGLVVLALLVAVSVHQSSAGVDVQKKADPRAARVAADASGSVSVNPGAADRGENPLRSAAPHADSRDARVTITGCLQRSDETFKLTDTAGVNSPTSRSWKSGFLKKRPAQIEVVDSVRRLNLASHVGERVSVTGTLVDREMRAGSVQRVAASCSQHT